MSMKSLEVSGMKNEVFVKEQSVLVMSPLRGLMEGEDCCLIRKRGRGEDQWAVPTFFVEEEDVIEDLNFKHKKSTSGIQSSPTSHQDYPAPEILF